MGLGTGRSSDTFGYDTPRHGCSVELDQRSSGRISHITQNQVGATYPTIRSYSDGIKVGCTFVTTEALRKIWEWHSSFLRGEMEKTWQ